MGEYKCGPGRVKVRPGAGAGGRWCKPGLELSLLCLLGLEPGRNSATIAIAFH